MSRRQRAIRIGVYLLIMGFIVGMWIAYGRKVGAALFCGATMGYALGYAEGVFAAIEAMDDE